ncbi:MAG: ABC transporter substrate-binding protein, partial [Chloroflexi bacterium]|nr:ABC transporter substrate-binding protein [Chloroflexota bacterium]
MKHRLKRFSLVKFIPLLLGLAFIIACGTAATEPATSPTSAPTQAPAAGGNPVPTATPAAAMEPSTKAEPAGTLNVGQSEIGGYDGHPKLVVNPALFVSQTAPLGEGLVRSDLNLEMIGWLAKSWSISDDFTTWTFNLQQGVQFHKGYGEMTAEDVRWSYVEGWANNEKHVRFSDFNAFWKAEGGSVTTPDDYTLV